MIERDHASIRWSDSSSPTAGPRLRGRRSARLDIEPVQAPLERPDTTVRVNGRQPAFPGVNERTDHVRQHALARGRDVEQARSVTDSADELKAARQTRASERQRNRRMAGHVERLRVLEHRGADGDLGAVGSERDGVGAERRRDNRHGRHDKRVHVFEQRIDRRPQRLHGTIGPRDTRPLTSCVPSSSGCALMACSPQRGCRGNCGGRRRLRAGRC